MAGNELKRRLNPMDAMFLFIEREEEPQTVGCVATFEGKIPFRRFENSIDSRLHLIPRYRQKVVPAPLNIGLPTWEYDPEFDIGNHIKEVKLEKPGTDDQLRELGERVFEGTMDMSRPPWEIYIVRGLSGDRTGMITHVHHCMVDGVAGVSLMQIIFDITPEPPKIKKEAYDPEPVPDQAALLYDALWDNAIEGINHWTRFQKSLAKYGAGKSPRDMLKSLKEFGGLLGDFLKPLHRMPFNRKFSGTRRFAFSEHSFAEARGIKSACGGTINDVALAVLAGAVRKYLRERGEYKDGQFLRVLCPVNVRDEDESGALGNRITFLPVDVPLDRMSPVERLQAVTKRTRELKESRVADAVNLLFALIQSTPPLLQKGLLTTIATPQVKTVLEHIEQMPPANLICTNVPGPQIPLYTVGKRLLGFYPLLPITLEMGISCGVTSYDQKLFFTLMADGNCAPDVDVLMAHHRESFYELRDAAAVREREYVPLGNGQARAEGPKPRAAAAKRVAKKRASKA